MTNANFASETLSISKYRNSSKEELRQLLKQHIDLLESIDPHLHILAHGLDKGKIEQQIDALFNRFEDPNHRPPLFGVPVGIKDIFRVDGVSIKCGSLLPAVLFKGEQAECVQKLYDAGAILFAQTATTEFAYFEPAATKNPHNPKHTPGGSSSGSAAGVAAGAFPLALGTQTVGSVIRPASYCGVVGMKPSYGKIPSEGVVYFSRTVDHIGFFCQNISELSCIMEVFDSQWTPSDKQKPLRIGVPNGKYLDQVPTETMTWFREVLSNLEAGGIEITWVNCLDRIEAISDNHTDLIAAELAQEHAHWFKEYSHLYRPTTGNFILKGQSISNSRLAEARKSCLDLRQELTDLMNRHSLDLWICPSTLGEAPIGQQGTGSPSMNLPWTHAGMPVISIPCGTGGMGLPLGIQCIGRFDEDHHLIADVSNFKNTLET